MKDSDELECLILRPALKDKLIVLQALAACTRNELDWLRTAVHWATGDWRRAAIHARIKEIERGEPEPGGQIEDGQWALTMKPPP